MNGMSASELAERAAVSRVTLRNIETGVTSARVDSLLAILTALGVVDRVIESTDPYRNDAARVRIDEILGAGGSL
ncbi:hypothetical protein ASF23_03485 [Curtobacterium sp. Leaf261]|nr:hypothetical protein ASF23_03485 [Curtobacterium sp. Leaf261]